MLTRSSRQVPGPAPAEASPLLQSDIGPNLNTVDTESGPAIPLQLQSNTEPILNEPVDIELGRVLRLELQSDEDLFHHNEDVNERCKALALKIVESQTVEDDRALEGLSKEEQQEEISSKMNDIIEKVDKQDPAYQSKVSTFLDNVDQLIDRHCIICKSSSAARYIEDQLEHGQKVTDDLLRRMCSIEQCEVKYCVQCDAEWSKNSQDRREFEKCLGCQNLLDPEAAFRVIKEADRQALIVTDRQARMAHGKAVFLMIILLIVVIILIKTQLFS